MAEDHPDSEWSAIFTNLDNLGSYLKRHNPPLEFKFDKYKTGSDEDCRDSITWVQNNFSMDNHLHKFALFVAIAVAHSIPKVQVQDNPPPTDAPRVIHGDPARNRERMTAWFHSLPWIEGSSTKGRTQPVHFISAVTAYIIIIYTPETPIGSKMRRPHNNAAGKVWNSLFNSKGLGVKWLAHLGLIWINSSSFTKNRVQGASGWTFKSLDEMDLHYHEMVRDLENPNCGTFFFFSHLFGDARARELADLGRFTPPPFAAQQASVHDSNLMAVDRSFGVSVPSVSGRFSTQDVIMISSDEE
ncbi:hypothetical protein DENSPDRAFT_887446 [Dentipellis sp. KUC8613]|nr:hypothetical protein DENSPDRAFT_887446 [Dentipellis sp. KUC8613]